MTPPKALKPPNKKHQYSQNCELTSTWCGIDNTYLIVDFSIDAFSTLLTSKSIRSGRGNSIQINLEINI